MIHHDYYTKRIGCSVVHNGGKTRFLCTFVSYIHAKRSHHPVNLASPPHVVDKDTYLFSTPSQPNDLRHAIRRALCGPWVCSFRHRWCSSRQGSSCCE